MGGAFTIHRSSDMGTKFLSENVKGSDQLGDLDMDVRIILKLVLKK
jgi:hypothetical protein